MTINEFYIQLSEIQKTLNAPKNQFNSFGKYKYRSCEDILEGVKPLLNGLFLSITDEIIMMGSRFYVKATATITDGEHFHTASAMAREEESKKGMDAAQVTGATSSYARKYCLNGLFGIDDSKDVDSNEHRQQCDNKNKPTNKSIATKKEISSDEILSKFTNKANEMTITELDIAYNWSVNKLHDSGSHKEKLTEVYNIRKAELEGV